MHNPKGCWRECIAATLALFCTTGMNVNAFAVFIPYLRDMLALTYTQSSNFIMVRSLFAFGSMFIIRRFYDKLEIRLGYTLSMGLAALAAFAYSQAGSYLGLCGAAAISGLSYGLGGMYPAAVLVHRWFPVHDGLAMGICAAGTGLAVTLGAPVLTAMAENFGVRVSLIYIGGFLFLCMVLCFFLIHNFPDYAPHLQAKTRPQTKRQPFAINTMFLAVVCIGILGISGYSCLSMHYTTEGFDPYQVSTIISAVGLSLTIGKFVLGELFDLWGALRSNWVFFAMCVLGCLLFSLGGRMGFAGTLIAACLFGAGDSVGTVGLTVYAKDLSTPETFAATQQQYQMAFMLGGLLSGPLPGLLATATGSYRSFYLLVAVLMILCTWVIQRKYLQKKSTSPQGK